VNGLGGSASSFRLFVTRGCWARGPGCERYCPHSLGETRLWGQLIVQTLHVGKLKCAIIQREDAHLSSLGRELVGLNIWDCMWMAPRETCLWGVLLVNAAAYICQTSVKILQKMSVYTGPGKSFRTELGLEKILKFDIKGPWKSRSFDHSNYVYIFQALWTGQCTIIYKIPKILLKQFLLCNCSMLNKFSALILLVGWQEGYAISKKNLIELSPIVW